MSRPLRVLVVGPKYSSANSRGGMASVVTLMRERVDERVRIRTVATYVDDTRWRRLVVGVTGVLRAMIALLTRRADVVHVQLAHRGSVVRKSAVLWTARIVGVPAVVHAHSYDFAGWFDGLGPLGRTLVRGALPARRWLVLGDALADEYTDRLRLAEPAVALPNPILPPPVAPVVGEPRAVVTGLFLGRHGERKGSYVLVDAMARLVASEPSLRQHFRVVAAGDGEVEAVRAAASRAGVTDVLEIRGWVASPERDALLAEAEIFVLPSYDEGLPMALLEAMGAGLAAVVTPVGAIGETVTDGVDALLVAPGDPDALAAALARLVTEPRLRTRLGTTAQLRASEQGVGPWFDALVTHWRAVMADR